MSGQQRFLFEWRGRRNPHGGGNAFAGFGMFSLNDQRWQNPLLARAQATPSDEQQVPHFHVVWPTIAMDVGDARVARIPLRRMCSVSR